MNNQNPDEKIPPQIAALLGGDKSPLGQALRKIAEAMATDRSPKPFGFQARPGSDRAGPLLN